MYLIEAKKVENRNKHIINLKSETSKKRSDFFDSHFQKKLQKKERFYRNFENSLGIEDEENKSNSSKKKQFQAFDKSISKNIHLNKNFKKKAGIYQMGRIFDSEKVALQQKYRIKKTELSKTGRLEKLILNRGKENISKKNLSREKVKPNSGIGKAEYRYKNSQNLTNRFNLKDLFLPAKFSFGFNYKKTMAAFAGAGIMTSVFIGSFSFLGKGLQVRDNVMGISNEAYEDLISAVDNVKDQKFQKSSADFANAYDHFDSASEKIENLGGVLVDMAKYFPYASQLSSGKNLIEAGKHISLSGQYLNDATEVLYMLKNSDSNLKDKSLLYFFINFRDKVDMAKNKLTEAEKNLNNVKIDDLPKDKRLTVIDLKNKVSLMIEFADEFSRNSHIFVDLLGGNGPRKYLFLFQNNQEMRATGGFIGSYGLLEVSAKGEIRDFFVDGIFNPDGQLKDKIVPPKPIQKISAAWSLHDSNWFPDFPVSAEKAILFYEKTGGPTVDGVITLTPTVMEKLLRITGPIEMEEYDVVLDADNFIKKTQYEVEEDYDKEENRPKKILSDLAPIVLDKLANSGEIEKMAKTVTTLQEALTQKHILLYSRNEELQEIISEQGWSGEILDSSKDYLSVINTNINGFKTDGVISEKINYNVEIDEEGRVVGTVEITRKHNGGNSEYSWWNKVNSNYMRIYVPKGSRLLEVEGNTKEINEPPLDYEALKFKQDPDVASQEKDMIINNDGTRIYEDSGKTVFADWVYVSPQEEVTVEYKYILPFNIDLDSNVESYSLIVQKQAGSIGSKLNVNFKYPKEFLLEWNSSDSSKDKNQLKFNGNLKKDRFIGAVFSQKE